MAAVLDAAREGAGSAHLIAGEPGIGKTALLDAIAAEAEDFTVLRCAGVEAETELPFSALLDLLTPVLDRTPELPEPQRLALEGALAIARAASVELLSCFVATLALMDAAGADRPVLALVDDLQWLDAASGDALAYVSRRVASEPIVVVFAARDDFAPPPHLEPHRLQLPALAPRDIAALVRSRFHAEVGAAALDRLMEHTGGNPLATVEVVAELGPESLHARPSMGEPLPPGRLISSAFRRRIAALEPSVRTALVVAAASADEDLALLVEAVATVGASLEDVLAAEAEGLVVLGDGRVRFSHPMLRSVVYAEASPALRRRAHGALARASEARADAPVAAWHAAAAAVVPDEAIADALERAAKGFAQRGGHLAVARALERAARLSETSAARQRRLLAAAEAARRAGRMRWARELVDEVGALAPADELATELAFARVRLGAWSDASAFAHEAYRELGEQLAARDPDRAGLAYSYAATEAVVAGDVPSAVADADRARALLGGLDDPVVAGRIASVLILGGDEAGAALLRGVAERMADGEPAGAENVAAALLWIEEAGVARELLDRVLEGARLRGDLRTLAAALEVDADWRFRTGDWPGALASATESARLAEESDEPVELAYSLAGLALVQAGRGVAESHATAARAGALAEAHGLVILTQVLEGALGLAALGDGDVDGAIAHLERARGCARTAGQRAVGVARWPGDLLDAYAFAGSAEAAVDLLERLESMAAGHRWTLAACDRARGLLADAGDYTPWFMRSLERLSGLPAPFDTARTELAWGQRLRRDRQRVEARRHLHEALRVFQRLGARPWIGRAERELEASGAVLRRDGGPAFDELTPQELQIARRAADGLSNKEIAGGMFLSVKTVETHLTRIYRKLGVRSRAGVASALRG